MIDLEELRPPKPRLTAELDWVLQAAFSPVRLTPASSLDPAVVLETTHEYALSERIGSRRDAEELPPELRAGFRRATASAAAIGLLYESTAGEVAEVAARSATPIVFLKGLALSLSGTVPAGARSFGDIDLLVPEEQAQTLFEELEKRDFKASSAQPTEQHLPGLQPPTGGSLEVHFALRGIEIRHGQPAGFRDLADAGALEAHEGLPGASFLPSRSLMAAHALVHGFQQHLLRPSTYPLFRTVADLIDLLPDTESWRELKRRWWPAIDHAVSESSFEATRRLCQALRAGRRPDRASHPGAGILFDHLLANSSDSAYARFLRRTYLRERLTEAHQRGALGEYLSRKIRPLFGEPGKSRKP